MKHLNISKKAKDADNQDAIKICENCMNLLEQEKQNEQQQQERERQQREQQERERQQREQQEITLAESSNDAYKTIKLI